MTKITQKYFQDNAFVEITELKRKTWKSKLLYQAFKLFAKAFYRNPAGSVAGWWQCWMADYKAWEYICRKHPTSSNWYTQGLSASFHRQLCSIKNIIWAASEPVLEYNEKKKLVATFTIQIWQDHELYTTIHCRSIESPHCYCKINQK